jgi:hypothetical protein
MNTKKSATAEELDALFDAGEEDITEYLDMASMRHPGRESKRVSVDFPLWMLTAIDNEADRLGISRQALIKVTMGDRMGSSHHR